MRHHIATSPKFSTSSSSRCSVWTPAPACSWPPPPCPPGRRRCCWASWTPGGRLPGGFLCLCTPPSGCGSCSSDAPNKAWWEGKKTGFLKPPCISSTQLFRFVLASSVWLKQHVSTHVFKTPKPFVFWLPFAGAALFRLSANFNFGCQPAR